MPEHQRQTGFGGVAVRALGLLLLLIGLALVGGGAWLVALGGSAYYLLAGVALVVSGAMIAKLNPSGAAVYGVLFVATVIWALWEVGLNGWALVPRIIAPGVLMVLVIAALPVLSPGRGRRTALTSLAALVLFGVVGGAIVANANRAKVESPVPAAVADNGAAVSGDWMAYGGTHDAQRFSPGPSAPAPCPTSLEPRPRR
jgi:quinoprotein glucose dehydrogenase